MIYNLKDISKTKPSSKTNAHHEVTDFKFHGMLKNTKKTKYFKNGAQIFYEVKKFLTYDSWKFCGTLCKVSAAYYS